MLVKCKLCNELFGQITNTHLQNKHHITLEQYERRYPDAKMMSEEKKRIATGWDKGLTKETNEVIARRSSDPVRNEKIRLANVGREITWADKISATKKKQCQNPEYLHEMMARFGNHQTKPEVKLEKILNESFPNQWIYCGDGSITINGKSPDFINVDGKKQIIEVFGRYWHKKEDEQERIDIFSKFGFSTLVFWEDELDNKIIIIDKIKNFPSVETLHEPCILNVHEDKVQYFSKEEK